MRYFSERNQEATPRIREEIDSRLWGGIFAAINRRIDSGAFGDSFPFNDCPDDRTAVIGTNRYTMGLTVLAEIPALAQTENGEDSKGWPLYSHHIPVNSAILDLIEFCYRHVAGIGQGTYHEYFSHQHLTFDKETGQYELRADINTMFRRNGSIYQMDYYGAIQRTGVAVMTDTVKNTVFKTGDSDLDTLLEQARKKYLDRSPQVRLESLHRLWGALERMKTVEHQDKKKGIRLLISKATSESQLATVIDDELRTLTDIGNSFQIRHYETGTIGVNPGDVDYLFHRAFATVAHLLKLKARGRT